MAVKNKDPLKTHIYMIGSGPVANAAVVYAACVELRPILLQASCHSVIRVFNPTGSKKIRNNPITSKWGRT